MVTLSGDALRGLVHNAKWFRSPEVVQFKPDGSDETRRLAVRDLAAFSVAGSLYERHAVTVDATPHRAPSGTSSYSATSRAGTVFLRVLLRGPISLYAYHDDRPHYYLEHDGDVAELISHELISEANWAHHDSLHNPLQVAVGSAAK